MAKFSVHVEPLEARQFLSVTPTIVAPSVAFPATQLAVPVAATTAATTPTPTQGGLSLTEVANQKFTVKLGEFTKKVVDLSLNAVITWGDGSKSDGQLVGSYATGEYYVQGTHAYKLGGTYKVDVAIYARPVGSHVVPTDPVASFSSVVKVLQASKGGRLLDEYVNQPFNVRLGEITEKVVDLSLNAVVDWGDGTQSAGKLNGSYATGEYYVSGSHTYTKTGLYKVKVNIFARLVGGPQTSNGPITSVTSVIRVNPLVPTAGGKTLTEIVNKPFTEKLGEFTQKVVDLSLDAVVDWGDGTHSDGTLVGSYATGEYYVQGKHTYAHTGTYKVDVKIFAHPVGSPILTTDPISRFLSVIKVIATA